MEDKALLMELKKNNHEILETLISCYCGYVSTIIRNQLGEGYSEADVEELASEVFFKLWQKRFTIKTTHLRGWLGTVARNYARSFQRKNKPQTVCIDDVILVDDDQGSKLLEQKERTRILQLALDALGEPDSQILRMYYYDEMPVASIAQHLRLHPEAVKSKIRRGREKIKKILRTEGYIV